jgi:hypothetical protein
MSGTFEVTPLRCALWIGLVFTAGFGWSSPALAQPACPPGLVELLGADDVVTGSFVPESPVDERGWPFNPFNGFFGQGFDVDWSELRSRALTISQQADHGMRVVMTEGFQVAAREDPAAGAQLLIVRLNLEVRASRAYDHGLLYGLSGSVRVILTGPGTSESVTLPVDSLPYLSTHLLQGAPFPVIPGESFQVAWDLAESEISGNVEVTCRLEFVSPNGDPIALTSCRGIALQTVPVQSATWSGIKALVR